ncbi:tRNA (adenosine(37)-N6)-threonylcarbamoyltransferase complex dimerization subunit type 1 TsaB [Marimonas arenosa]|uniref:tRNA (Adenosine(37)-N6)-threonylcarbamoyltransferase complex dimerization subunit type 1 TsaB n=1 Tax=Marimonas arenosa TaxID=1795305 RepID=A0AAE3WF56_9RHOB|nr:tRNA (adenosine(37)-N6)-threonylcarbamoyltransferase complex dimerization subunit type 1 TsaB [Marimonas arenosa]MDQ2092131.1 tRNA (adenosine(37)-N6)-threonylcarbamoyltransferase complex dimerization subunit type 1 TsaB [Marimonas arenosa]
MPSEALVLGFDTSAAHCAAALLLGDRVLAATSEDMGRGQAERLMPMLEEMLSGSGKNWSDLKAIGVGVGPGNFTGIRISVAAARGLALALNIPARGVDTFSASELGRTGTVLPTVPAPRGQLYLRPPGEAPTIAAADSVDSHGLPPVPPPAPAVLAENIARIAAAGGGTVPAAPVYVRPADASPSSTPPPTILADDP